MKRRLWAAANDNDGREWESTERIPRKPKSGLSWASVIPLTSRATMSRFIILQLVVSKSPQAVDEAATTGKDVVRQESERGEAKKELKDNEGATGNARVGGRVPPNVLWRLREGEEKFTSRGKCRTRHGLTRLSVLAFVLDAGSARLPFLRFPTQIAGRSFELCSAGMLLRPTYLAKLVALAKPLKGI